MTLHTWNHRHINEHLNLLPLSMTLKKKRIELVLLITKMFGNMFSETDNPSGNGGTANTKNYKHTCFKIAHTTRVNDITISPTPQTQP